MIRLNDISIRNKLILMQVFTSLMVLGIFSAVYIITDIRFYKQRKAESMISLARVTGINSLSTLQFDDNETANGILAELQKNVPEIVYAAIFDKQGNLFASSLRSGLDSSFIPTTKNTKDFTYTDKALLVNYYIVDHNEKAGRVILASELSELKELTRSKFKIVAVVLPVALGFSFLIAILIQTYISRRLLHVVNTMKAVSNTGNYNQAISDTGKDEISTLATVFNAMMQQVKENQQRKDEFIGIASHELKTPLTTIKGYIELLHLMEERDPNKQFVQKALENTNKLERLIKDLLDVSNIQSGQMKLEKEIFDIDQLVDETISAFQMISKTHTILRKSSFNHQTILADRQRIEQVLLNLFSNAIKYSPGENSVIVDSLQEGEKLILRVRDFGIGVPEEEQASIFDRFYRTKDVSKHIVGFGLGLYICRDIIQRHNGEIWMQREDKGSSFYFSLPLNHLPIGTTA
ncbi:MAG: ATP-binding protein [Bacteroidota bacterium]